MTMFSQRVVAIPRMFIIVPVPRQAIPPKQPALNDGSASQSALPDSPP
jgi:hypothetical protein